jgi:hypothetical protein
MRPLSPYAGSKASWKTHCAGMIERSRRVPADLQIDFRGKSSACHRMATPSAPSARSGVVERRCRFVSRRSLAALSRTPAPEGHRGPDELVSSRDSSRQTTYASRSAGEARRPTAIPSTRNPGNWRKPDGISGPTVQVWYRVGTASWPMALSGPPPPTATGRAALSGVVQGPDLLTASPAELLSFYPGVNVPRPT